MTEKKHIKNLSKNDLLLFCSQNKEKPFRGKQLYHWLWQKCATEFDQMTDLPVSFRDALKKSFLCNSLTLQEKHISKDLTCKYVFATSDNLAFESVLIPAGKRLTACISTQIGCALRCSFCATGSMGYIRNLTYCEIHDQIALLLQYAKEQYKTELTNIVVMGMGEPLLNYENTITALHLVSSKELLNFSPSRITISTVGIPEGITKMADENCPFQLAVSLHSAIDEKRKKIMPVANKYSLDVISNSLKYYHQKTKKRITIEYLLLHKVNDQIADAQALADFCRSFPVKINLIPYNKIHGAPYEQSTAEQQKKFINFLQQKNLVVNLRNSKGADIAAACGQLVKQLKNSL